MALVDNLTKLPATDGNFESALKSATKAQLQLAVKIMQMSTSGQHKARIEACERQIKELEEPKEEKKSEKVAEKVVKKSSKPVAGKSTTKAKENKKQDMKIVAFPGEKPKIKELAKSTEAHTYEECLKKLMDIKEKYTDEDNLYVINGLIDRCKEDQDFRNNVMLKDKTYDGFYQYMLKAAMAGYCVKVGNVGGMLSKEKALDLAFDYFNMLDIIKPEEKKKVAKKLTEEVNKIAADVNEETDEEPNIDDTDDSSVETELTEDLAEEDNGQLTFNF